MKMQLALDLLTPQQALETAKKAAPWFSILEVGTPMVVAYGMEPVRMMREQFPQKEILADIKIIDAGRAEALCVFEAGADWVSVLAAAEDETIRQVVQAARERGGKVLADLVAVPRLQERALELETMGVDRICVHTPRDLVDQGADPLADLEKVAGCLTRAEVAVAGGISQATIARASRLGAHVIVVGGAVTRAEDPAAAAAQLAALAGEAKG